MFKIDLQGASGNKLKKSETLVMSGIFRLRTPLFDNDLITTFETTIIYTTNGWQGKKNMALLQIAGSSLRVKTGRAEAAA